MFGMIRLNKPFSLLIRFAKNTDTKTLTDDLLCDQRLKELIGIHHSIRMGPLIVVGSIHARSDQSVADIITCLQRRAYIRGIVGIDINRIAQAVCLRK